MRHHVRTDPEIALNIWRAIAISLAASIPVTILARLVHLTDAGRTTVWLEVGATTVYLVAIAVLTRPRMPQQWVRWSPIAACLGLVAFTEFALPFPGMWAVGLLVLMLISMLESRRVVVSMTAATVVIAGLAQWILPSLHQDGAHPILGIITRTALLTAAGAMFYVFGSSIRRVSQQIEHERISDAETILSQLVETFCASVELKDPYTRGHSERMTEYLLFLAEKVYTSMSETDKRKLRYAGLLHDVGKIHVPEGILNKPSKLMHEEFAHIRHHPQMGADIISHIPSLADTIPIILHHHERFDGNGYPAQLRGDEIPLDARIAALADTFDALTSNRSYRNALNLDHALQEVIQNSGSQFDPMLVSVFVREYDGLRTLYTNLHRRPFTRTITG